LYGTYSTAITHLLLSTDHPPISEVLRSPIESAPVRTTCLERFVATRWEQRKTSLQAGL
jgi:hypothetical protein